MVSSNRGPQVAGIAYAFVAITTIVVGARIYCRAFVQKAFGLDDYLCVLAQVCFLIYASFSIAGVHYGTGQRTEAIIATNPYNLPIAMRNWWSCEPTYVLTNMALKLSIGVFMLRLCVVRWQRWTIYAVVALTEVYSTFFALLFILQCFPTSYFWDRFSPDSATGKCIDSTITAKAFFAYSAIACLTDWVLALLPIFLVKDLQMNRRTKWSVAAILAAGAIASTATIVRIPYLPGIEDTSQFLWATSDIAIWSTCETGIGITASAAVTLRPLFRQWFNRARTVGSKTESNNGHWSKFGNGTQNGYVRSRVVNGNEEFALRDDVNRGNGITTTVEADIEAVYNPKTLGRTESQGHLKSGNSGWEDTSTSEKQDDEISNSDSNGDGKEPGWEIRKTVVQTRTESHYPKY